MPADPSTYCPVCGLAWQVRGCAPGKCVNMPFDIDEAVRHDVTCACHACGNTRDHSPGCPAARYIVDHDAALALLAEWSENYWIGVSVSDPTDDQRSIERRTARLLEKAGIPMPWRPITTEGTRE